MRLRSNSSCRFAIKAVCIAVAELFGLGCFTSNGYTTSLLMNFGTFIFAVVIVMAVLAFHMYKAGSAEPDPEKAAERAKKIFDKFDTDGDGIGLEEVTEIVRQVDPDVTDESIQKLFKAADTDGSEQIDFDEFMAAINSDHTDEFSFDGEMTHHSPCSSFICTRSFRGRLRWESCVSIQTW